MSDLGVRSLEGDSEDPLGDPERCGIAGGDMLEERPYRREARIAGLDRVRPCRLEIVEKGEDDIAIEIVDGQRARLALGPIGGEQDQQA